MRFDNLTENWEGEEIRVTLEKMEKTRSALQNNYYWGKVIVYISETTGYNEEEMHEALKVKFLKSWDAKTGLWRVKSTTALSTTEFEEYIAQIKQWAWDFFKVHIPKPNEGDNENTINKSILST